MEAEAAVVKRMEGKVAFITGAASGIGAAMARLFAANGARVVIADIQDELGQQVVDEIGTSNAVFVHCDVSQESQMAAAVDLTVDKWKTLDVFVNNAAIVPTAEPESLGDLDMAQFDKTINVNVRGTMLGTKHAARIMVPRKTGVIINMSSASAVLTPDVLCSYVVSKHAVVGITKNAAAALGKHCIRVNCISPHAVPTPAVREWFASLSPERAASTSLKPRLLGHELNTEDIAKAAMFLATSDSAYISGHNLVVDGGVTTTSVL